MREPFLSIIVPIYNMEKYVGQCIQSIINQSWPDFELLLVDDGSTDKSLDICNEFSRKDDRIYVLHKSNNGLVSARKYGIQNAVGQYIGFVDADDFIEPGMMKMLCETAIRENSDIVIADIYQFENKEKILVKQMCRAGKFDKKQLEIELYPKLFGQENFFEFTLLPTLCNKICRHELIEKWEGKVDEQITMGEDAACSFFMLLEANSIYYLKDYYLYGYRVNTESMTHKFIEAQKIVLQQEYCWRQLENYINMSYWRELKQSFFRYSAYIFGNYATERIQREKRINWKRDTDFELLRKCLVFNLLNANLTNIEIPRYFRYLLETIKNPCLILVKKFKIYCWYTALKERY